MQLELLFPQKQRSKRIGSICSHELPHPMERLFWQHDISKMIQMMELQLLFPPLKLLPSVQEQFDAAKSLIVTSIN